MRERRERRCEGALRLACACADELGLRVAIRNRQFMNLIRDGVHVRLRSRVPDRGEFDLRHIARSDARRAPSTHVARDSRSRCDALISAYRA
eukprot:5944052-Pleurochrysis_carterae.AAC.3